MTFTDRELMVIAAGREIHDGDVVFVGMRLPLVAFAFAKRTHAPAALGQAANLPIAPHAFYFGPGLAATLHVAATFGGDMPVEFPTGEYETPLLARPITARDGWVEVPRGPGLGVEVNEEAIRRYPYAAASAQPFVLHR